MARDWHASFEDLATHSNPEFWSRFGRHPLLAGQRVLDLGCGGGPMSLQMAEQGANVLGVDIDDEFIAWANEHVAGREVSGSLAFETGDVTTMDLVNEFDVIVSKDTFEHIAAVGPTLEWLSSALKPDGRLWVGFSPLYYSPWGDHGRTGMKLPWAHTLPQRLVFAVATRRFFQPVHSFEDLGLNALTPSEFRDQVARAGLVFESLVYNSGDKRFMPVLSYLRRFAPLERYTTVSIYAVLRRSS